MTNNRHSQEWYERERARIQQELFDASPSGHVPNHEIDEALRAFAREELLAGNIEAVLDSSVAFHRQRFLDRRKPRPDQIAAGWYYDDAIVPLDEGDNVLFSKLTAQDCRRRIDMLERNKNEVIAAADAEIAQYAEWAEDMDNNGPGTMMARINPPRPRNPRR